MHHTWTVLCADTPASSTQLGSLGLGVVLAGRRLERLGFLEGKVLTSSSADLESGLSLFDLIPVRRVVAWTRLEGLFFLIREESVRSAHREGRQLLASVSLCCVVTWAWDFKFGVFTAVAL